MTTWIYVFDEFKPLDIEMGTLLGLSEKDPLKLFEITRDVLKKCTKNIRSVRVYDHYFDPHIFKFLIFEYLVKCGLGEIPAKLIYSKNHRETLAQYYEHEKKRKSLSNNMYQRHLVL